MRTQIKILCALMLVVNFSCSVLNMESERVNSSQSIELSPAAVLTSDIIYNYGFDNLSLGPCTEAQLKTALSTRYIKGADRSVIINTPANVYSGKAIQIKYPKGKITGNSGIEGETDIKYSAEEMYLSYWVKFKSDFDFRSGGKLPGLGGSESFPHGENDFSTRLMWREGGVIEFYLHGYNMNNSLGKEPYRVYWDHIGNTKFAQAKFIPGKWHQVKIFVKMNTPGQRDGLLRGWLDGKLMCEDSDNANMRASGQSLTRLNHLFISTFFGGSSKPELYAPIKDEYAYFDEFVVTK